MPQLVRVVLHVRVFDSKTNNKFNMFMPQLLPVVLHVHVLLLTPMKFQHFHA